MMRIDLREYSELKSLSVVGRMLWRRSGDSSVAFEALGGLRTMKEGRHVAAVQC